MKTHKPVFLILLLSIFTAAACLLLFCLILRGEGFSAFVARRGPADKPITDYLRAATQEISLAEGNFTPLTPEQVPSNPHYSLSIPTCITKIEDTYFIVDCYHDQVIYHENLSDPLSEWQVLTDQIDRGHTIASDGKVYLVDDTENNRVLIFEKKDGVFYHTQTFDEIGNRPHYIVYDGPSATFYVWSSMNGEMYLMRHGPDDTRMYLTDIRRIDALSDTYVRSFTIMGDNIFFVSGIPNSPAIIRADLNSFRVRETYPVPDSLAGMIQLAKIEDYYYITVSTDIAGNQDYATIVRTKKLEYLQDGGYEPIYDYFVGGGTPYYIGCIDGTYYLTEHRLPGYAVWSFRVEENNIHSVELIY